MQKQKSQYEKQMRRFHEQAGAMILLIGTMLGVAVASDEARRTMSVLTLRPALAIVNHSTKESETVHMPVRFDQVLRAPSVSGKK